MAKAVTEKRFDMSVYLLRPQQVPNAEAALFVSSAAVFQLQATFPGGKFLALPIDADEPKWLALIETMLVPGSNISLATQMPGGVLWIPRGGKHFVFTFGFAHMKLKDEWLEPEFGKKVALSVIPQGQVVEVRAEQVFAKGHIASERAPRASAVREFGFEADRDLVSAVAGVPSPKFVPWLGTKVRGGTGLRFGMCMSKFPQTLDVIAERFDSGDYKKSWPQMDNLVAVRDSAQISLLDAALNALLATPRWHERVSLAAPAMKNGERPYPQHYVIGRMSKGVATAPYLLYGNWEAHLRDVGLVPSTTSAVSTTVHFLDENEEEIDSCRMYQCFGAEVSVVGQSFVLTAGVWYAANRKFVKDTNQLILGLSPPPYTLPAWVAPEHEGPYNARTCTVDKSLWLFDKELVNFGGGQSRFEFCDVMHFKTRTLYFVKHPSGSASVSHLCEQVRRTVENFFTTDGSFRGKLKAKILKQGKIKDVSWLKDRPQRQEWNLCVVSMGKAATQLPFFAKCGVARLVRELEQGGYNISFLEV